MDGSNVMPDAGWYADPADQELLRYWDGATWTPQTRPVPRKGLMTRLRGALAPSRNPQTTAPELAKPAPEKRPPETASRPRPEATVAPMEPSLMAERKITRLSSQGRQSVVGEHYQQAALRRVVGRRRVAPVGNWDAGLRCTAYLVREPTNKHDRHAVMVQLAHEDSTEHVGYLPAEDAKVWQPLLRRLEAAGRVPECPCLLYRSNDGEYQAVLRLASPDEAEFENTEPDDAHLLDAERQCAVTKETDHQDALARHQPGQYWVTLHPATTPAGKYAGEETIEVRLEGERVGILSAVQGKRYLGLLTVAPVVACEAWVFDGPAYRRVQLWLPKVD